MTESLPTILLAVAGVLASLLTYFLPQKMFHFALWFGFASILLFSLAIALYVRNVIIIEEIKVNSTPKIKVQIVPEYTDPSLSQYKYPLQEYMLFIENENEDSVPVNNLTIEFLFPYIISIAQGSTHLDSGGNVRVIGLKQAIKKNGVLNVTEEIPAESNIGKSMSLSIQKWKENNNNNKNSNIVVFSCPEWTEGVVYTGKIVVDLTMKPKMLKTPDEIGKYHGKYFYKIRGKKFPVVKFNGDIKEPDISPKLAEHNYDKGLELVKQKGWKQSILEFNKVIDLNPNHAHAYFTRGCSNGTIKNFDNAISDFSKAIEIAPRYAKAYFYRALTRRNMGDKSSKIQADFKLSCDLGLIEGCKEYYSSMLESVNPSDGYLEFHYNNPQWLERDNKFINIIPPISKDKFAISMFRDNDNIFKSSISNSFCENIILEYSELERLKDEKNHPNHTFKITWFNGENKLYINSTLVDVYPLELENSKHNSQNPKGDADLFRALSEIDTEKGSFVFSVSREEWLEMDGKIVDVVPHIFRNNFEIHGYKDVDNTFKLLISNSFSQQIILKYKDLEKLKNDPSHPKHVIAVTWGNSENKLYIDGNLVDSYSAIEK